jgi:hypothetical protein
MVLSKRIGTRPAELQKPCEIVNLCASQPHTSSSAKLLEGVTLVIVEGFDSIISTLFMAKELHDIGRYDLVEKDFFNELCIDNHYENIIGVISSVFSVHFSNCDENFEDVMVFEDDVISEYFLHAHKQIKLQKLDFEENPYVQEAREEVQKWFSFSYCTGNKLLAYTKTKKTARKSKLIVYHDTGCGCNAYEHIAYGLIKLYDWFEKKCAEFKSSEAPPCSVGNSLRLRNFRKRKKSRKRPKTRFPEVIAA